jgi:alcohol dehydrogenase
MPIQAFITCPPAQIIVIDLDDNWLEVAKQFGATDLVNSGAGDAVDQVMALTVNRGVDVSIEAVGLPATFAICESIVGAGGTIANIGARRWTCISSGSAHTTSH